MADDEVELEEPVLTREDAPNEFLIGRIGEQDPTGWVDQWMLNELGIGWMQYLHDPWGQILYRAQPSRDDIGAQIAARSARYLFGTQSWMCIFLGYFWNDNAYTQAHPHRSRMEQEASRRSGGTRDGVRNTPDDPADLIGFGAQDAAGVSFVQAPTLELPAGSAFAVPGELYNLNAAGEFVAIGARGWIPAGNLLERSAGIHVVCAADSVEQRQKTIHKAPSSSTRPESGSELLARGTQASGQQQSHRSAPIQMGVHAWRSGEGQLQLRQVSFIEATSLSVRWPPLRSLGALPALAPLRLCAFVSRTYG